MWNWLRKKEKTAAEQPPVAEPAGEKPQSQAEDTEVIQQKLETEAMLRARLSRHLESVEAEGRFNNLHPSIRFIDPEVLVSDFAKYAVLSVKENDILKWQGQVMALAEMNSQLADAAMEESAAALERAGYDKPGHFVKALLLDRQTARMVGVLQQNDEVQAQYLASQWKTEEDFEEELLTALEQFAQEAELAGAFLTSWPAKLAQVASGDTVLAAEAARRVMCNHAGKTDLAQSPANEQLNNLVRAFNMAMAGCRDLRKSGHYFPSAEIAADLGEMAELCHIPAEYRAVYRQNLNKVLRDWQDSVKMVPDEEYRAVAEKSIREFAVKRLLAPAPKMQPPAP